MKYLVFSGNEQGVMIGIDNNEKFIKSLQEADLKFDEFVSDYGCAVMYEVTDEGLKEIKMEHSF